MSIPPSTITAHGFAHGSVLRGCRRSAPTPKLSIPLWKEICLHLSSLFLIDISVTAEGAPLCSVPLDRQLQPTQLEVPHRVPNEHPPPQSTTLTEEQLECPQNVTPSPLPNTAPSGRGPIPARWVPPTLYPKACGTQAPKGLPAAHGAVGVETPNSPQQSHPGHCAPSPAVGTGMEQLGTEEAQSCSSSLRS